MPDVTIGATAHAQAAPPSVYEEAGSETRRPGLLREACAGITAALVTLPFVVSAGVLGFAPLGPDFVAAGAAAGLLCAIAGGLAGAIARTNSFVVNTPSTPLALIQASFLAALLGSFGGDAGKVLAIAPLSIVLAGLWQALFAWSGLVRVVKFTPYPVMAGFVTGLAIRTFSQQAPRLFDLPDPAAFLETVRAGAISHLGMAAFGLAVVVMIAISNALAPRVPAVLVGLVLGTLAWHGLSAAFPTLELGRTIGAMSGGDVHTGLHLDWTAYPALLGDAGLLQTLLLTSLTLAALAMLDFTFTVRTAQSLCDIHLSPRRDLAGQGFANLAGAVAGGMAITSSLGTTNLVFENGGRTRVATVAMGLCLLLAFLLGGRLIAAMPMVVLTAMLVFIAWGMWDRWCMTVIRDAIRAPERAARTRARRNLAILVAVAGATVVGQPVLGAITGVILSCLVFIAEMSRPIVRRRLTCDRLGSKRIRSQHDRAILTARGRRIVVYELQGVLFFGNADDLSASLRGLPAKTSQVILDLRRVGDLDTSGATVLRQIAQRSRESGIRLVVAGPHENYAGLLAETLAEYPEVSTFADLDEALEDAENRELARYGARAERTRLAMHETDLAGGLAADDLGALTARVTPMTYRSGEALCRTGDPADRLWIIARGSVSIRLEGDGHGRRIAGLGPGTSVGEMGLLDRRPRSADVIADEDVEAYMLKAEDFDDILQSQPRLGQSLLATIARLTAQRLRDTSLELRVTDH